MSRLRRFVLIAFGIPVLLFLGVTGVGLLLPRTHEAASRALYPHPPDEVWAVISDLEGMAAWRPDVERVERLPDREGLPAWREVGVAGELSYEVTAWEPPRRFAQRIAGPDLPFSGAWDLEIAPAPGGATLTIVERSEIGHPAFRFLARYAFGHHSTMDGYLRALGERFGEEVEPEHLSAQGGTGGGTGR